MKRYTFYLTLLTLVIISTTYAKESKIVGLMAFRNEENFLAQHLKALSLYTDAIIVLDDASTDNSLKVVQALAAECNIEHIITKQVWLRDEPGDRNKLLQAGREIGGTHFICLDADEMFTSNCLLNNQLRNAILQLQPGEALSLKWIQLWRSVDYYCSASSIWASIFGNFIFCDDGISTYNSEFIHTSRIPINPRKSYNFSQLLPNSGVLHFQFVNWDNLLLKQAWYRCLERIRLPHKSIREINNRYAPSKQERGLRRSPAPHQWFEFYSFFDRIVYDKPDNWRKEQVNEWFEQYGKDYFKELDIWDVDWSIEK